MESTKAKQTKLEQFRVSIALLIAGTLFLLGVGSMSLVLNNVEALQITAGSAQVNTRRLSKPDTAFEYVVAFLNDSAHRDLPFSVDGKPLKDVCTKVTGVSLASVMQTQATDTTYTFDVTGKVECKNSAEVDSTQMFDVKGTFNVKQMNKSFQLTAVATAPAVAEAN